MEGLRRFRPFLLYHESQPKPGISVLGLYCFTMKGKFVSLLRTGSGEAAEQERPREGEAERRQNRRGREKEKPRGGRAGEAESRRSGEAAEQEEPKVGEDEEMVIERIIATECQPQ